MGESEGPKVDVDARLEHEIRRHFEKYIREYESLPESVKKDYDLLEYRHQTKSGMKRIIDRDLVGDYLSLKAVKSNNRLQWVLALFVVASSASAVIEALKVLNLIH